jgi:translation initiation factor 1A
MAKKTKRSKNSKNKKDNQKRALEFKDDMQEYAKIEKSLGDRRIMVVLPDSTKKMAIIPGRFRKRCWMKVGDIILISYREYQKEKIDVCYKYDADEARLLMEYNEIPPFFAGTGTGEENKAEEDLGFDFEDDKAVEINIDDI